MEGVCKSGLSKYGSVFHDNDGFGWYVNKHSLLKTEIGADGYVTEWATACPWNFQNRGHQDHL